MQHGRFKLDRTHTLTQPRKIPSRKRGIQLDGTHHKLSTDTISEILTKAANHARKNDPSIPPKIHCHLLRKTKAMDLYKNGIPMPIIMQLLGHENMTTTHNFYAFATLDMMRTAINQATPPTNPENITLTKEKLNTLYTLK